MEFAKLADDKLQTPPSLAPASRSNCLAPLSQYSSHTDTCLLPDFLVFFRKNPAFHCRASVAHTRRF